MVLVHVHVHVTISWSQHCPYLTLSLSPSLFQAPCCNKTYPCRLCHDEKETHEIDRFAVKEVVCRKCDKRQPVSLMISFSSTDKSSVT